MTLNKRKLTLGELRIRSTIVYEDGPPHNLVVGDFAFIHHNPEQIKHYSGIPLTAEILTDRLGLVFDNDETYDFPIDDFPFWIVIKKDRFYLCTDYYGGHTSEKEVKYVHTIQNIAFDLSDEELEFKTKEG